MRAWAYTGILTGDQPYYVLSSIHVDCLDSQAYGPLVELSTHLPKIPYCCDDALSRRIASWVLANASSGRQSREKNLASEASSPALNSPPTMRA